MKLEDLVESFFKSRALDVGAKIILICAALWLAFAILTLAIEPPRDYIPPIEKAKLVDLMQKKHGVVVAEIHGDGSYWFERDGELCRLQ